MQGLQGNYPRLVTGPLPTPMPLVTPLSDPPAPPAVVSCYRSFLMFSHRQHSVICTRVTGCHQNSPPAIR